MFLFVILFKILEYWLLVKWVVGVEIVFVWFIFKVICFNFFLLKCNWNVLFLIFFEFMLERKCFNVCFFVVVFMFGWFFKFMYDMYWLKIMCFVSW